MITFASCFALAAHTLMAAPAPSPTATTASPGAEAPPAEAKPATDERLVRAEKLYKARKYVESARELESLWADTKQPNALYNAALARFAAGHYSHAISYLEAYISTVKDAPSEAMDLAKFQLAKAKERSSEVPVMIGPGAALSGGAELTIRRLPDSPDDRRPDLHYTVPAVAGDAQATLVVFLDPGRWTADVNAHGFVTPAKEITIGRGKPEAVVFTLGSDPRLREAAFRVDIPADAALQEVTVELRSSTTGEAKTCTLRPFEGNECKILAETGTWEIRSESPGFLPFKQVITLTSGEGPASYTLALTPEAVPEPEVPKAPVSTETVPKKTRIRLAGALNASGLPIFVTGLGLAVYGSNQYDRTVELDAADCESASDNYTCRSEVIKAIHLRSAGLSLVGVATGLFVTGLTGEFDVKARVWYAELGAGAALLVGGAGWMAATTASLNRELNIGDGQTAPAWEESIPRFDRATNQRLAAGMLLGTGLGLVTGATVGLLIHRRHAARRGATRVGPFAPIGGAGVAISGRF